MTTKVTQHALKINSLKYFRGNASLVRMGSFGRKKDPIGAKAYLDIYNHVNPEYLKGRVQVTPPIDINWQKTTQADVGVGAVLNFFGIKAKAAREISYENAKQAKLKLLQFSIIEGPLTDMLNNQAVGARNYLADEGKDGRIVSEIFLLISGELAEAMAVKGREAVSVEVVGQSIDLSLNLGSQGSQTIRYSPGTTFAYKLHKVKRWSKGKENIEKMEDDYKGMG